MFSSLLSSPVTKRHVERKVLQTLPLHLFEIVCDVDKYSQFLPLCTESKVLRRWHKPGGSNNDDDEWMEAQLTVGLPPFFTERYVSRVHMTRKDLIIETKSLQSKWLDSLSSRWKLTPILQKSSIPTMDAAISNENDSKEGKNDKSLPTLSSSSSSSSMPTSCWVDFSVEITVSDPLVVNALDHVLRQVAGQQVAAFEQRCQQIPIPPHLLL